MPNSSSCYSLFQEFAAKANKFALLDLLPSHRYEVQQKKIPVQFFKNSHFSQLVWSWFCQIHVFQIFYCARFPSIHPLMSTKVMFQPALLKIVMEKSLDAFRSKQITIPLFYFSWQPSGIPSKSAAEQHETPIIRSVKIQKVDYMHSQHACLTNVTVFSLRTSLLKH